MNEQEFSKLEDLLLSVDEDGKAKPEKIWSPVLDQEIEVRPFTYGYYRKNLAALEDNACEWPDEVKVDFLRRHVVKPDLSDLTVEILQERMDRLVPDHLITAVVQVSFPFAGRRTSTSRDEAVKDLIEILGSLGSSGRSTASSTSSATGFVGRIRSWISTFMRSLSWRKPERSK